MNEMSLYLLYLWCGSEAVHEKFESLHHKILETTLWIDSLSKPNGILEDLTKYKQVY